MSLKQKRYFCSLRSRWLALEQEGKGAGLGGGFQPTDLSFNLVELVTQCSILMDIEPVCIGQLPKLGHHQPLFDHRHHILFRGDDVVGKCAGEKRGMRNRVERRRDLDRSYPTIMA